MKKRKLLIATTNDGKLKEIKSFFETLPFELLSLADLDKKIEEPEETEETIEGNAILKAKYYGEKTGLLTLSDDGGIFLDAFDGWPGIRSSRIGADPEDRIRIVLDKMKDVENRKTFFRVFVVLYDPGDKSLHGVYGEEEGILLKEKSSGTGGFGYDPIMFVPELGKTNAELTVVEKNSISHRGKAFTQMKYHLQKTFGVNHLVVPLGLLIKDEKIFMQKRNDPHRPEFHEKWEFPGGAVEFGESVEETLLREVKEESGYDVEIVKLLQGVRTVPREYPDYSYQVYALSYVCKIVGGEGESHDEEVLDTAWVELDEMLEYDLMGDNKKIYEDTLPELKEVISKYQL